MGINIHTHIKKRQNRRIGLSFGIAVLIVGSLLTVLNHYIPTTHAESGFSWSTLPNSVLSTGMAMASSSDGQNLIVGTQGTGTDGSIYTSTDGGANWLERTSAGNARWVGVSSSTDGTHVAAISQVSSGIGGYISTSSDSGVTWTQDTSLGQRHWDTITSSSNGQDLVVGDWNDMYRSTDGGLTWVHITSVGSQLFWLSIASSADGSVIVGGTYNGHLFTSRDGGATWSEYTGKTADWSSVATSSDGSKQFAVYTSNIGYVSTDYGVTWSHYSMDASTSANIRWIASSTDGSTLLAVGSSAAGFSASAYISHDYGKTWTKQTSAGQTGNNSAVALATSPLTALFLDLDNGDLHIGTYSSTVVPSAVTNLAVDSTEPSSANISWNIGDSGSSKVTDYYTEYSSDGGTSWQPATVSIGSDLQSATISNLQANTTYLFGVSPKSTVGQGPRATVQGTTAAARVPSIPSNVVATAGLNQVGLSWATPSANGSQITSYNIRYKKKNDPNWTTVAHSGSSTTAMVASLQANVAYLFQVQAVNGAGMSSWGGLTQQNKSLPFTLYNTLATFGLSNDGKQVVLMAGNNSSVTPDISFNSGDTWNPLSDGGDTYSLSATLSGDGSLLYKGTNTSLRSTDHGANWQPITESDISAYTAFATSYDGSVSYAFSTFNSDVVYKSVDKGQTWTLVNSDPISWFGAAYADSDNALYATGYDSNTSQYGVYRSTDGGQSFQILSLNLDVGDQPFGISVSADDSVLVASIYNNAQSQTTTHALVSNNHGISWSSYGNAASQINFQVTPDGSALYYGNDSTLTIDSLGVAATPTGTSQVTSPTGGTSNSSTGTSSSNNSSQSQTGSTNPVSEPTFESGNQKITSGQIISSLPTFSGIAGPYDSITVTVHSDVQTCQTTADATGAWSCTLKTALPSGNHSVSFAIASAVDSTITNYGPFSVVVQNAGVIAPVVTNPIVSKSDQLSNNPLVFLVIIVAVLLLIIGTITLLVRRRNRRTSL